MAQSQEYLEDNLRRRYWEDFSGSPYSDHREPENKRQCLEAAFAGSAITTLKAGTVTSTLTPISQFDDFGAIEPLEDTWSDFQDRQDQQPSNYENITTVDFGTALPRDLVTNSSDFCLEVPEAAGPEELLLTPGSAYDHSDFDAEAVLTSQGSATNEATISRDVPEKPDHVCFGMLIISANCHTLPSGDEEFVSASVEVVGDTFKLYSGALVRNVGVLISPVLGGLARKFAITFSASCKKPKHDKSTRKTLGYNETLVHIVIHGLLKDANSVGQTLWEENLFLQHPSASDTAVPYNNPHLLLPPGVEMPRLEVLATGSALTETTPTSEQYLDKSSAAAVFQAFDAVDGPVIFAPVSQSPRLKTQLKQHQLKALAMMAEKERGILEGADFPSLWDILQGVDGRTRYQHLITGVTTQTRPHQLAGGIIADEMGLGKTLSVLALIAWYLDSLPSKSTRSSTTLIITTLSTVPGWQQQISRHFRPGQIRTAVYQGSDRRKHLAQLFNNDIVVTTYDTLRQEWKSDAEQGALFSKNSTFFSSSGPWARVVLDEAHHIRNRSSKLFQAISDLRSQYRWCLTGTPIHNKLDDFGALLSFIGVPPFTGRSGKASFEEWVSAPVHSFTGHSKGLLRLRKLVAATCLRRTKIHVQDQLMLPACVERQQFVDLDAAERRLYDWFKQQASSLLAGKSQRLSLDTKGTKNILSSINLLRLICNHGERLLPNNALELWKTQNWSTFDLDFQPNDIESEECEDSLSDPISSLPRTPLTSPTLSDAEYWPSSKLKILLNNLQEEQRGNHSPCEDAPIKSVIFSLWTKMLDQLEIALRVTGFTFQRIDGSQSLGDRSLAMKTFGEDSSCTVMLATIGSAAEGIDFTSASNVHILEPHWNPMIEAQAVNRLHRIGQLREVVITRYIVKDSIETYVQELQNSKLELVQQSFGHDSPDEASLREDRLLKLSKFLAS